MALYLTVRVSVCSLYEDAFENAAVQIWDRLMKNGSLFFPNYSLVVCPQLYLSKFFCFYFLS